MLVPVARIIGNVLRAIADFFDQIFGPLLRLVDEFSRAIAYIVRQIAGGTPRALRLLAHIATEFLAGLRSEHQRQSSTDRDADKESTVFPVTSFHNYLPGFVEFVFRKFLIEVLVQIVLEIIVLMMVRHKGSVEQVSDES